MRFTGAECAYCKKIFEDTSDVVVCPECGSPHHRECWLENGRCANTEKHEEGFFWVMPEELRPKPEEPKPQPPANAEGIQFKNGENAVICPHCGSINYGNDALCMRCRRPLQNGFNGNVPDGEASSENGNNLVDFYERFGGLHPETPVFSIPASEYCDYIGEKKSGRYIRKFANMERYDRKFSVSICAILFGPIWFFYRKLYKEGLIFFLISLIISGVVTFTSITEPAKKMYQGVSVIYEKVQNGELTAAEMQDELSKLDEEFYNAGYSEADNQKLIIGELFSFLSYFNLFAMGFAANTLYKKKIIKDIMKTRGECSDMESYRQSLREKGGVSVSSMIIGIILSVIPSVLPLIPMYYYIFTS